MPWNVFYSYSHVDAELRQQLGTWLAPLRQQHRIVEWHDRRIEPGADWQTEISAALDSAHLIMLLVSADFLASEYCFGVEVERALNRLKQDTVKVLPILLRPCLWEDSRFSQLQFVPRDGKAVTQYGSLDAALQEVAAEIRTLVLSPPPEQAPPGTGAAGSQPRRFDASLDLVRQQVAAYARLYERTRQRMKASDERTRRMEEVFQKLHALAIAAYPLLDDLADSPSPGERLAAIAILQTFAAPRYLPLLVKLVGSEKPFVGFHAAKALHFAVSAMDVTAYPELAQAIAEARDALTRGGVSARSDRQKLLRAASTELEQIMALATEAPQRKAPI